MKAKAEAEKLVAECCQAGSAIITKVEQKEKSEKPPALFDLTSLQREANRQLGFTAQQTLDYMQALYEKKLVTYPLTDSRYLTDGTAEKREAKLQKAVDAANKLIAKLKAEIDSLKQEISDYKSVHSKLRAAELERENTELRRKVRSYEDVIQRNNLWRFFHPLREKAVTRDEAR